MADSDTPARKIQVANSRPEDSGRGLAHLPRSLMAALGVGASQRKARGPYTHDEWVACRPRTRHHGHFFTWHEANVGQMARAL